MEHKSEMLFIPGGEFEMGISSEEAENLVQVFFHPAEEINPYLLYPEAPNRKVTVPAFSISKYEVTNREYQEFVDAGCYHKKDLWKELVSISNLNTEEMGWDRIQLLKDRTGFPGPRGWKNGTYPAGTGDHPVQGITWFEAVAYCRWKKCRLPTEIEWEYVARGGNGRMFPWGDAVEIGERIREREAGQSIPVGSVSDDRTSFGVVDMGGNVSEWVAETWYPYVDSPLGPLEQMDEEYGIIRGGNYLSEPYQMRVTYRERRSRLDDSGPIGFRCAR